MIKNLSFQKKIVFGFSLLSLAGMLGGCMFSYMFASDLIRKMTQESLEEKISSVRSAIEVTTTENSDRLKALIDYWGPKAKEKLRFQAAEARSYEIENQVSHEKVTAKLPMIYFGDTNVSDHAMVDQISLQTNTAVTIFAATEKGLVRISTSLKTEEGKRAVFTYIPSTSPVYESLKAGKRYVGRAKVLGAWYHTAYEPILINDQLVGAFFIGNKETSYDKIKGYLKAQKMLQTGYFYIFDSSGTMILHPTLEGKNVIDKTDTTGRLIFKEMLEKKSGTISYNWINAETKLEQKKLAVFHYFAELDWMVASSLNLAEAEAAAEYLRNGLVVITAILIGIMMFCAWLYGAHTSRRLSAIAVELEKATERVGQGADELNEASTTLAESSMQQSAGVHETVSALDQIRATVETNLHSTERSKKLSVVMKEHAEAGGAVLNDLITAISEIEQGNQQVQKAVQENNNEIRQVIDVIAQIREKTKVINDIVFQTKLLSFNASVEAARAGQHGTGFAVVAEEVGRLAALSGGAANDINESLAEGSQKVDHVIEMASHKISGVVKDSSERIQKSVAVSRAVSSAFEEIVRAVNDVAQTVDTIAQASQEQATGVKDISSAMHQIDVGTQRIAAVSTQARGLSDNLSGNSKVLNSSTVVLVDFVKGAA